MRCIFPERIPQISDTVELFVNDLRSECIDVKLISHPQILSSNGILGVSLLI